MSLLRALLHFLIDQLSHSNLGNSFSEFRKKEVVVFKKTAITWNLDGKVKRSEFEVCQTHRVFWHFWSISTQIQGSKIIFFVSSSSIQTGNFSLNTRGKKSSFERECWQNVKTNNRLNEIFELLKLKHGKQNQWFSPSRLRMCSNEHR